jgi:hypothetical protein
MKTLVGLSLAAVTLCAQAGSWAHSDSVDKMTGDVLKVATLKSDNQVKLKPPYAGKNSGLIQIMALPSGDFSASVSLDKGQWLCGTECDILVRFDGGQPMLFKASSSMATPSNRISFKRGSLFYAWVAKSKTVFVQALMYQDGAQVLEFSVDAPPLLD